MNFFNLGPLELVIIGIVALLVVGPRQLPEIGRMVGRWMKTFREASDEMKRSLYMEDDFRRQPPPKPRPPLQHTPAKVEDPAEITDRGANQGKYNAEDLDPDQSRVETDKTLTATTNAKSEETEASEEAKRSHQNIDYDREGAD